MIIRRLSAMPFANLCQQSLMPIPAAELWAMQELQQGWLGRAEATPYAPQLGSFLAVQEAELFSSTERYQPFLLACSGLKET